MLQAVAGPDPRDSTCSPKPVPDYNAALDGNIKGLRIGVPQEYWVEGTQPGVIKVVREGIEKLRQMGAEVSEVSLPHTKYGEEVKRRIMLGTYALSSGYYDAYYKQAEKVRSLITQDFDRAFGQFDVLVSPASPTVAFKIGEISDPYQMYLQDVFTIPANLAGICGVSIPGGFSDGLPVGVQLLGNAFAEDKILCVADAFERVTDYHTRWPNL